MANARTAEARTIASSSLDESPDSKAIMCICFARYKKTKNIKSYLFFFGFTH